MNLNDVFSREKLRKTNSRGRWLKKNNSKGLEKNRFSDNREKRRRRRRQKGKKGEGKGRGGKKRGGKEREGVSREKERREGKQDRGQDGKRIELTVLGCLSLSETVIFTAFINTFT